MQEAQWKGISETKQIRVVVRDRGYRQMKVVVRDRGVWGIIANANTYAAYQIPAEASRYKQFLFTVFAILKIFVKRSRELVFDKRFLSRAIFWRQNVLG